MSFDAKLLLLPDWLTAVIVIGVFVVFAVIGLMIVRKFVHHSILRLHNDVAGFIFATIGVMYAVLLAFVVLVVWEQFDSAKAVSEAEGSHAFALYRDISMYPDTVNARFLKNQFREYISSVIDREYTKNQVQEIDTATIVKFRELFYSIQRGLDPKSPRETVIYQEIMKNLNLLAEKRSLRMMALNSSIPNQIWWAIIIGGMLTIGFTFLFGTEHFKAHLIMSISLSVLIGMVVFVILELQYPYSGDLSIRPDGYKKILEWSPLKDAQVQATVTTDDN